MKKKYFNILSLLMAFCLASCDVNTNNKIIIPTEDEQIVKSNNNQYENPIYPLVNGVKKPTYTADPFVIRDEDTKEYYMYCTQTDIFLTNGEKRFVNGPIFSSNNLIDWNYVGDVFSSYKADWGTSGAGVWAPSVLKVGDKYNYYYALSTGGDVNPGIGVATSSTPYGPWDHKGKLFNSDEIGVTNSIDPFVFYDDSSLYMAFGSYGGLITLVELESDGLSLKNGLEYQKENKHDIAGYPIYELNNYEGVFIFKEYEKYYLLLSTGSTLSGVNSTYHVVVASSDSLFGPYLDSNGKDMFGPNRGDNVVSPSMSGAMGVGHCTVIQDDAKNYWMLYHGYDTKGTKSDYRSLYLDQLIFDPTTKMPHVLNNVASNHVLKNGPYIEFLEK